jgi:hypothetical protein
MIKPPPTPPYSKYLKTERKRDKNQRIKAITEWYRYLHLTQNK